MAREQQWSQELLQRHTLFQPRGFQKLGFDRCGWNPYCVQRTNKADSVVGVNNAEAFARPVAQEWFPRPPGNAERISCGDPLQHYCGKAGKILQSRKDFYLDAFSLVGHLASSCLKLCFVHAAAGVNMQQLFGGYPGQPPPSLSHSTSTDSSRIQPGYAVPANPPSCPSTGLGLPQSWVWPHTGLAVLFTGSLHRLLLCAGQGLTPSLVKPWIKKQCLSRLRWD